MRLNLTICFDLVKVVFMFVYFYFYQLYQGSSTVYVFKKQMTFSGQKYWWDKG